MLLPSIVIARASTLTWFGCAELQKKVDELTAAQAACRVGNNDKTKSEHQAHFVQVAELRAKWPSQGQIRCVEQVVGEGSTRIGINDKSPTEVEADPASPRRKSSMLQIKATEAQNAWQTRKSEMSELEAKQDERLRTILRPRSGSQ